MPHWLAKIYTYYALFLFALLLLVGLIFYAAVRLFVPYRHQIKWVYGINKVIMLIWSALTGFRYKVENEHLADRSNTYIVVMNHQNLFDMFTTARHLKIAGKPLIKAELLRIPILGWIFAMAALAVTRENKESRNISYQVMVDELKKGISILIFPEGTRNTTENPLIDFKDGAFKLALETGVPILPVVIMNIRDKSQSGKVLFKPGNAILQYLEPIDPATYSDSLPDLKAACYDAMQTAILQYDPYFKTN